MGNSVHERKFSSERAIELEDGRQEALERRRAERRQLDELGTPPWRAIRTEDALWTAADVARFLRVGRNRPYELAERGELPCIRIGQRLRFDPAKVREFLERQTHGLHFQRGDR
jgi:excisionase family DNA binding protein